MKSQIKYGAVLSYAGIIVNILIGLLYTPWMIRTIGKADYGLYTLACSIIGIFVFDFGLGQAVTKFAARYIAEGNQSKVNKLMGITYKLYIFADIVVLVTLSCLFLFLPNIYSGLSPEELDKFKVVYAIAASFSVLSFPFIPLNGILSAYELFVQLKSCDIVHKLIIVVLMTASLLLGYGLYALVIVNAVAGIAVILMKLHFLNRKTTLKTDWGFWDKSFLKEILSFSIWITVAALSQRLVLNICPSILGMLSDSQNIAIFGVAMTLEAYVYTFANAINGLFIPKVTQLVVDSSKDRILPLMIKVGRIQFMIIGLIIIGFVCVGVHFINVWLGPDFQTVYVCALLMIAPSFIGLSQQIGNTAIVVEDKVKQSAYISVVKAVLNILLAFPLTKLWGVLGIALSIFISYCVSLILTNLLYHKGLGLNILMFFKKTLFKMIIPMTICAIVGYSFNIIFGVNGWGWLFAKVLFIGAFYILLFIVFVLNEEEKSLINSTVRKFLRKK